jgi:AAA domain
MRVGISGTHGTGKTTLAGALCAHLPGHVMADEPYYLLEEEGHEFGFPPSPEDYRALLARSLQSLSSPPLLPGVVFDRTPLDYLAYLRDRAAARGGHRLLPVHRAIDAGAARPLAADPGAAVRGGVPVRRRGDDAGYQHRGDLAAVIPDRLRSRVTGAFQAVNHGTRPLGAVLGGLLGTTVGLRRWDKEAEGRVPNRGGFGG